MFLISKKPQPASSYRHGCRYPVPWMVTFRADGALHGSVPDMASHPCDWIHAGLSRPAPRGVNANPLRADLSGIHAGMTNFCHWLKHLANQDDVYSGRQETGPVKTPVPESVAHPDKRLDGCRQERSGSVKFPRQCRPCGDHRGRVLHHWNYSSVYGSED